MKKKIALLMLLLMTSSCNSTSTNTSSSISDNSNLSASTSSISQTKPSTSKVLLAYFSCTGTTESVANKIANAIEVTTFKIEPKIPYTEEDLNYSSDCRANREQNDPTSRPEIASKISDISSYDTLILGYPIWWGKAPKIIYTFLESYNFSNYAIYPFCTSGSSLISGSETDLHTIASNSTWKNGKRFTSNVTNEEINNWLKDLY